MVSGEIGYFKYPDVYAGLGNDHPSTEFEIYKAKYPRFNLNILKRTKKHHIVGLTYQYQNTQIDSIITGGIMDTEKPEGYKGSIYSSLGLVVKYDSRDFIFAPKNGWFASFQFSATDPAFGASFTDSYFLLDIRKYTSFLKKHGLAFQLLNESHFGTPAFNHTAIIGGENNMRGYRFGVFRDLTSYVFQTEFRSAMFWKFFRGTFFGAVGGVAHKYIDTFKDTRFSYGLGLWVYPQPKKRLFVRFDYGQGWEPKQSHGLYVSMGSAF